MVTAFVMAVVTLAIEFGLELERSQIAAIEVVVAMGLGLLARSQVSPVTPAADPDRDLLEDLLNDG